MLYGSAPSNRASVVWDHELHLPVPPLDAVFSAPAAQAATLVFGLLAAAVVLYGLHRWIRRSDPIVILMAIGGLTTILIEPFLDVIGLAWHPIVGQNTAFSFMGRSIPWWVVPNYMVFFGGIGTLAYLSFRRGVTTKQMYLWFLAPMLLEVVQEETMMHFDLYYYYGHQPLILLWKFPWWWAPCNSMGVFLGICALAALGGWLRGWRLLLVPVIMPVMDGVGFALVGLPTIISINTEAAPIWLGQIAAIGTFALTLGVLRALTVLLATDSPWRRDGRLALRLTAA
jgi:hypothetical protein